MSIFMGSTKSWNTGWTHGRSPERALKNKLSLHNTTTFLKKEGVLYCKRTPVHCSPRAVRAATLLWRLYSPSCPLPSLIPCLSLSLMASSSTAIQALAESWLVMDGVCGGGWAAVAVHVLNQTEIFMYVCLCLCVSATSHVPFLGPCLHMWVFRMKWNCA